MDNPTLVDRENCFAVICRKCRLRDRVVNRLITNGWHQGCLGGPEGPNCLLGAVAHETVGEPELYRRFIQELFPNFSFGDIRNWNDARGRTLDGVLELLENFHRRVPL